MPKQHSGQKSVNKANNDGQQPNLDDLKTSQQSTKPELERSDIPQTTIIESEPARNLEKDFIAQDISTNLQGQQIEQIQQQDKPADQTAMQIEEPLRTGDLTKTDNQGILGQAPGGTADNTGVPNIDISANVGAKTDIVALGTTIQDEKPIVEDTEQSGVLGNITQSVNNERAQGKECEQAQESDLGKRKAEQVLEKSPTKKIHVNDGTESKVDQADENKTTNWKCVVSHSTSRTYENAAKIATDVLQAKYPGIEITTNKVGEQNNFEVVIRKDNDEEVKCYSLTQGDPLPTKKNVDKFEQKLSKVANQGPSASQ